VVPTKTKESEANMPARHNHRRVRYLTRPTIPDEAGAGITQRVKCCCQADSRKRHVMIGRPTSDLGRAARMVAYCKPCCAGYYTCGGPDQ
jgi:hypothetical protein